MNGIPPHGCQALGPRRAGGTDEIQGKALATGQVSFFATRRSQVVPQEVCLGRGDDTKNPGTCQVKNTRIAALGPVWIHGIIAPFFGFGILVAPTFMPIVYFGIVAAITMLSAMIAELFVTPALILLFKFFGPERRRDR